MDIVRDGLAPHQDYRLGLPCHHRLVGGEYDVPYCGAR